MAAAPFRVPRPFPFSRSTTMTTWPGAITYDNTTFDAGGDDPAVSRAEIFKLSQDVANMVGARAATNGVASLDGTTKVPSAQLPAIPLANLPITPIVTGISVNSTPGAGAWVVPAGVTRVKETVIGGGGGGGYTSVGTGGDHGGGAGAGGVTIRYLTVVPASTFNFVVGDKGTGKANAGDGDGTAGGNSSSTSPATATPSAATATANGGDKGYGPGTSRFGGAGGAASGGDINLNGGAGASGATRGGMGGANAFGGGVAGATGYGGGGGFGSGGGTSAFDGLKGAVIYEW
jgi:hypothetical protein